MKETLRNISAFFRWIAELYRTWFLPYHYDGDDEDVEEEKTDATAAAADVAPDRSPRPSPPEPAPTAEQTAAPETPPAETQPAAESSTEAENDCDRLVHAMAFRGNVSKRALAAVLGEPPEKIADILKLLIETQKVADLGGDRYVLAGGERKSALRAEAKIAEWLARFQNADMENRVLDAIGRLCPELPLRLHMGKDLFFQLRHRPWMVWQSTRKGCRVRLYGTLNPDQWRAVQQADRRAKQIREAGFHPYRERDCTLFLWRSEEQFSKIAAFLPEAGREFLRQTKQRRAAKPDVQNMEESAVSAKAETGKAETCGETPQPKSADKTLDRAEG